MQAGTVEQVVVYPVKSLAGSSRPAAEVGPDGLAGDRAWIPVDAASGAALRARDVRGLRDLAPSGDPDRDAAALTGLAGAPVRLEPRTGPAGAAVHLVSRRALELAAAGEVPEGCAAENPRANLVLALGAGGDERAWVGRRLRVGGALLEVSRLPKHCLGVYAEVLRPGTVAVGDPVVVEDAGAAVVPG
ncbi:MOSC N-terminal beta barrel domain-containing protein [Geodermatophilus sp. SYSU D00758]